MMREEHVTAETARLLKKAGFPVEQYQAPTNEFAPYITQSVAMRWLRELNLSVRVCFIRTAYGNWFWDILDINTEYHFEDDSFYTTYEAAAEAGIQAACEYLIKKGDKK